MSGHRTWDECVVCGRRGARDAEGLRCAPCGLALVADSDGVLSRDVDVAMGSPPSGEGAVHYPAGGAVAMMRIEDESFWFSHRNDVLHLVLDRFVPRASVWDIGGGNGLQAMRLERGGRDVVLVEPGSAGCRNARRRGVRTVIRASLEELRLPDGSLPAMTLLDVIEHLSDPVRTLAECRRVLCPEGKVVVTVPAYELLWSVEDDYAEHQRRYTVALLREHLEAAQLRLEWVSHFFAPLAAPIFLLRALPYALAGGLGRRRRGAAIAPDLSQHRPGGLGQLVVERLLARELSALRASRRLPFGSSIVGIASRA